MNKKISKIEFICIFIMISINTILLNTPQNIINICSTGAFLNSIYIGILALVFIIILTNLFNYFPSSDILDISNFLGGKKLKIFLGILFMILLILMICISLAHFTVLLKSIYFKNSPILFILAFFIISALICNLNGFGAIKKSICFYFPITLLTIVFIIKSEFSGLSFLKVTPFLGESFESTLINGSSNIFVFSNIVLIYFLLPFLENNKKFKNITIFSFVISWILLILTIMTLLSTYPINNTISDINSVYILTRKIEISNFIQRSDGLFVFIWILSFLSYISFFLYFITLIMKKIFQIENEKMMIYPLIPFIIGITFYLISTNLFNFTSLEIYKHIFNFTVYIISLLIIFLAVIKKKLI